MHAEIIFYTANGCGFCVKAKQMLKDLIASGKIMMKDAKEAPKGVRGFPHFVGANGKTHTGLPPSAAALMDKLGAGGKPIPPGMEGGACRTATLGQQCNKGLICGSQNVCVVKPTPVNPIPPGPTPGAEAPPGMEGGRCRLGPKQSQCNPGLICGSQNLCVVKPTPMIYKPSLTTADIVGIVIASVAGVALIVALCFLIAKAAKKGKKGRKSRK